MNKKEILKVDMDGVIADFAGAIKELEPNKTLLPNQNSEWVYDVCKANPRIFNTLKPIRGAIKSIQILSAHYDIYFLSTPMWCVPESFTDKRLWIEQHFGAWSEDRLILTKRKDLNIAHYLVDDRITNGVDKFTGQHIHFGTDKFPDWETVEYYLLEKIINKNRKPC